MKLDIIPYEDGFGASSEYIFDAKALRSLAEDTTEQVRKAICKNHFLEAWVGNDVYSGETFSDRHRRQ